MKRKTRIQIEHEQQLLELVQDREISKRIRFLLANKNLGTQILLKEGGYTYRPNCHGTTIYVLGCKPPLKTKTYSRVLPQVESLRGPGYLDNSVMEFFLENVCTEVSTPEISPFPRIVSFWSDVRGNIELQHTLVYEGRYNGQGSELVFHQPDTGRVFEVSSLEKAFSSYERMLEREQPDFIRLVKRFHRLKDHN
ncbi:MAG: hypothetical protein WC796_06335 [Candidatus Pacearchaeota archaeon]|jgi:hypothetical protein